MPRMDKLSTYCTTIGQQDGKTVITYHRTPIVSFDQGSVTLRTGGWDTVTTRRKMNQAATQFGLEYGVYRDKGETYVKMPGRSWEDCKTRPQPFQDGMTFPRA